ncbi:hypothetical protein EW146_g4224 [Bondarzewia mesenterica]|uniref:PH domain-containing protein n=1 Tax=Bondarzewia mesenterica TaxID=1095465 RepID=A0A4S4LV74_9AGAM|nr:hypothetical protein EW146_g4224 [Bondarzewia mesenterica]
MGVYKAAFSLGMVGTAYGVFTLIRSFLLDYLAIMEEPQYADRKAATKSYRPKGYMMSPGLMRAREPYKWRNALTGVVMAAFAAGAWAYAMNAVKQDTFDDVDEEARALAGSGAKSLEDEERERRSAAAAPIEFVPAVSSPATKAPISITTRPAAASTRPRGVLPLLLDGPFPRLLDPTRKTLVWGAPPVDKPGRVGDPSLNWLAEAVSMHSTSQSSFTLRNIEAGTSEPLYQVKLLSALRSGMCSSKKPTIQRLNANADMPRLRPKGDPALIHPFLAELGRERRRSQDADTDLGAAALHLAIRCASVDTVSLLLSHRSISPNSIHPPASGTTALHLAASLGRVDVVNLLLEQDGIDDTLRDRGGKTCKDVARTHDVVHAINDSRSYLTASYRSQLRSYIHSPSTAGPPPELLRLLSSPRVRLLNLSYLDDASGTTLLHEAARRKDLRLIELAVRGGADIFVRDRRGRPLHQVVGKDDKIRVFLRQFTNHDTTLIDDTPTTEPPVLKGYLNKYTNVARGYSTRWFVLKDGVLSYYRHQEDETVASRGSITMKSAILRVPPSNEKVRFEVQSTPSRGHTSIQKWYIRANHPVEAARWTQAISKAIEWYKHSGYDQGSESDAPSKAASVRGSIGSRMTSFAKKKGREDSQSATSSMANSDDEEGNGSASPRDAVGEQDANDESSGNDSVGGQVPPHADSIDLQGNSTVAQLELTAQLLTNMTSSSNSATRTSELQIALKESLSTVQGMMAEYVQMVNERDEWWHARLAREQERQTLWEESLASVVREGEELERELRTQARRHSRVIEPSTGSEAMGTIRPRPSKKLTLSPPPMEEDTTAKAEEPQTATVYTAVPPTATTLRGQPSGVSVTRKMSIAYFEGGGELEVDTDEEDEFFDAIESNALPNLVINDTLAAGHVEEALPFYIDSRQYAGYQHLRQSLGLASDNRPPTSLWSVLKHSIGKDLTKISFPVFFNEPTSMLQRMAEDMEFSECLDAAAAEADPLRRIAFVAGYAMSNYSSTIGRIAKPFNPMLSETFEYVRLDKQYRYVSEQVSHHPPISACYAESPRWHYYGEVDAQNRFTGKSFEIRPTGVAHVDLFIPAERGPDYPKRHGKIADNKVIEHFSWKKVTTNVSGFILGSPTIDHYGDMIVTNHRTGDECVLTFKPRGWRGKDAFEISGYVADSQGNIAYEIAGRWNSRLVARPVGAGSGSLNPDVAVSDPDPPPRSPSPTSEFILLWRNSEKPPAPFNLTPFAITLNDCPENTLKPYMCPTDCRLRPDQRAFEKGLYEYANTLKSKQEEFQRFIRKAREEGRMPPHKPRWFTAETEGDTGERVWTPSRIGNDLEYWAQREMVFLTDGRETWKNVDRIFVDDEP